MEQLPKVDLQSRFAKALRTQPATPPAYPCPFGHETRIFESTPQLYEHVKQEHPEQIAGLAPLQAREQLKQKALQITKLNQLSEATAGGGSAPDLTNLSLEPADDHPSPPYSGKKRPAESEARGRRGKAPSHHDVADSDYHRAAGSNPKPDRSRRLFDPSQPSSIRSPPQRPATDSSSVWPRGTTKGSQFQPSQSQSPSRNSLHRSIPGTQQPPRQGSLADIQRYDPRYPNLLLQPDSRPISQEQLSSEVKSIYAGLTMIENKCNHVDRAQAQEGTDPNHKLTSDHWQALIALHRTLLHEHHDFFLASQHPSASPALRRLATKYSMPARMWKHGIHSFLELLRRHLPDSIDHMLAFIYLSYQMVALLYETVTAFEDTWIECLGDLGRYRMAVEDEDLRDRETWAGVARSWYTKAADKNPNVGRLYHHLAILARPNALQQLYYYCRSLTCVKPFPSARESVLTLLDPILGRSVANYSHALPIDTSYIKAHALLFEQLSTSDFQQASSDCLSNLDNHIGRVTAKWKEQGVYIAVSNISAWFEYGVDLNALRQVFLFHLYEYNKDNPPSEERHRTASPADQQDPVPSTLSENELRNMVGKLAAQEYFQLAKKFTNDIFALVLQRIGDKNVLPHVHIMLAFWNALAASPFLAHLLVEAPHSELVAFLNALIRTEHQLQSQSQSPSQSEDIDTMFSSPVFPKDGERSDELPLPEDHLIRGLMPAHNYFPKKWFARERDEEERYLELASTVKSRVERVLRLGYQFAQHNRWITYNSDSHTFSTLENTSQTAS